MDNTNSYTDSRGTIRDLFVNDEYSITHITFTEGAVRGNHYHKETTQYDFILNGKLSCVTSINGYKTDKIVTGKETIRHLPNCAHAYKAIEPTEMISICFGKRKGENYEEDTFRLTDETKLI